MSKRAVIVLLGAPGAGKGTLAARLCSAAPLVHISTGDLFRQHIREGTSLGKQAKECIDQGLLVPDVVTLGMLLDRLDQPDIESNDCGVIIDGFPRTFDQAAALFNEAPHLRAILLDIDQRCSFHRIAGRIGCPSCGHIYCTEHIGYRPKKAGFCDTCPDQGLIKREDDNEELMEKRWNSFVKQTGPAIEFYKSLGRVVEYDAHSISGIPIEEILTAMGVTPN